jgi:hypothetical protein
MYDKEAGAESDAKSMPAPDQIMKLTRQHCDFYWAAEAVEWAYESFVDDIERTRPKDEDEGDGEDKRDRQNGEEQRAQGTGNGTDLQRDPRVGF